MNRTVLGGAQAMKAAWQLMAAAVAGIVPLVTSEGAFQPSEWNNAALVALGVGTVYIAANDHESRSIWHYTKTFMSSIASGGVLTVSELTDGITLTEWWQFAVSLIGVGLVYWVPNDTRDSGGRHRAAET